MDSNIFLLKDDFIEEPRDFNSEDIESLLRDSNIPYKSVNEKVFENLSSAECRILIISYTKGDFSSEAIENMIKLHSEGTSLFFSGDLPNKDKWYPLKNMLAYKFHLTRAYDDINISASKPELKGLTEKGQEIIGELEDYDKVAGKTFPGLRITAFPPDKAYPLLAIDSWSHAEESTSVVAVERKCEKFFGAKFAQIGFAGGEPRENVDGAYQLPWKYDSGLLNRNWSGIKKMFLKLLKWLEPDDLAVSLDYSPVCRQGEQKDITLIIRNLTGQIKSVENIEIFDYEKKVKTFKDIKVEAFETLKIKNIKYSRKAGIHSYKVKLKRKDDEFREYYRTKERIFPEDSSKKQGFGFSTYWAFRENKVNDEFKFFCTEVLKRGAQYIRVNIPWEDVEPDPGNYNWTVPDQMLDFAEEKNFFLQFWMFPTTRGSGLADGGVPWWTLKEPAVDRYGNKGYFPSIWSPFYRKHYFSMLEKFTERYADEQRLSRFIFDFGNSDFPYGYYYYGGDNTIFDYSPHERKAFAHYLTKEINLTFSEISRIFSKEIRKESDIYVPYSEEIEAFRIYLEFRTWSIYRGIKKVHEIVKENAPDKMPEDPPGHGLGSIADLSTYFYGAKSKHWQEEMQFDSKYVEAHNAGKTWGGEAWQVGGDFRQYDDALFQSVRLNADYHSLPGIDLGIFEDDTARVGYIRRTLMGAERAKAELAVFDRIGWDDFNSLAHLGVRMDFPVDLLYAKNRYDFSCYKLLTMPDSDFLDKTSTGGGAGMLVPTDEHWYWILRRSVMKGLKVLVFPETCRINKKSVQRTFLRQVFNLEKVKYGPRKYRKVSFADELGGEKFDGLAREVIAEGKVLASDSENRPVLVEIPFGKGSVLMAGYDTSKDSLDKLNMNYEEIGHLKKHTLYNLCEYCNIKAESIKTDKLYVFKEMIHRNNKDYLLLFSHCTEKLHEKIQIKLERETQSAYDLSSGEIFPLKKIADKIYELEIELKTREGRYLSFYNN